MHTPPTISIVMPTYNRADHIVATIESIRRQTYSQWELLVVDDGSTDDTKERVEGLHDQRVQFCEAGRTGNIIALRLKGIALATGDLLAFMDSDDLWAPEKLHKQVAALEAHPEAGFSLTGGYNFRVENEPLAFFYRQQEGWRYGQLLTAFFRSEVAMLFPTLLLRRCCVSSLLQQQAVFASDVDFLIALAAQNTGVVLYEPLFYRRLHAANTSNQDWEKGYTDKIVVIESTRAKGIITVSLASEALFKLYINFGEKHLLFGQQGKAIQKFFQAWKNRPQSLIPVKKTGKAVLALFR